MQGEEKREMVVPRGKQKPIQLSPELHATLKDLKKKMKVGSLNAVVIVLVRTYEGFSGGGLS